MQPSVHGIHHVTVISGDAQENLDFYVGVMGMRLVKKSVNQDATDTYHLFYADGAGTPGTDLTFFPWPALPSGQLGTGLAVEVPFAVPTGSLSYWQERFKKLNVHFEAPEMRFGEKTLPFTDPHGLQLALVETDDMREFVPWDKSPVPAEFQLRGMHAVRIWERAIDPTIALLSGPMGFKKVGEENGWVRLAANGGGSGCFIELKAMPDQNHGEWGMGVVHHVAWRTKNSEEELSLQAAISRVGLRPTPQIDRFWFKSVYFREPGGTLFELATDGPGFDRDEDMAALGEKLILPPWLERERHKIEIGLPLLNMPDVKKYSF